MIHGTMHQEGSECEPQEYGFCVPAVVGRSKLVDVTILHSLISRRHCEFFETNDGRLAIRDLDSLNGTFVGETRIKQGVLRSGDLVTLGPFTYRIEYSAETAEDEATEELRSDRKSEESSEKAAPVPADDPTAYGGAGQATTIESAGAESAGSPRFSGDRADDDDAKATETGSIQPLDIGHADPEPVSGDDPALQDFLKKLP